MSENTLTPVSYSDVDDIHFDETISNPELLVPFLFAVSELGGIGVVHNLLLKPAYGELDKEERFKDLCSDVLMLGFECTKRENDIRFTPIVFANDTLAPYTFISAF